MSAFLVAITWGAVSFVLPIMLQQEREEVALKSRGVDAIAQVLKTWSAPGSARTAPSYHARFAFRGGRGSPTVIDEAYVTRRDYERLKPGARAPIVFDPRTPSLAQINFEDEVRRRHPVVENTFWIVVLFSILALAWMGHVMVFREALRERRATDP